jgi:hypothetical protein
MNAYWPGARQASITVSNRIPASSATLINTADPALGTGAAAIVLSHGRNGSGARNLSNNINVAPAGGTDEEQNTLFTGLRVIKREYTDQNVATYGAFDDIVLPITASEFIEPLVESGSVREPTPTAKLNAANDYVIAQIIASKTACLTTCIIGDYYYTVPAALTANFPAEILGWNATYNAVATNIYVSTNSTASVYTINVNDGMANYSKSVSANELKTALGRMSGFH